MTTNSVETIKTIQEQLYLAASNNNLIELKDGLKQLHLLNSSNFLTNSLEKLQLMGQDVIPNLPDHEYFEDTLTQCFKLALKNSHFDMAQYLHSSKDLRVHAKIDHKEDLKIAIISDNTDSVDYIVNYAIKNHEALPYFELHNSVKLAGEHGKTNVLNYFLTNPHIPFHWNQDENVLIDFANAAFVGACTKGQFVFVKEFLENPEHKKLLNSESYCEGILRAARNNQVKILDFLLTDENRKFNINWTHEELFKEICKYQCSEALTYLINDFKIGKNPLIEDILANRENGKKLNFNTEFLSKAENLFNSRYLNVEPSKPKM